MKTTFVLLAAGISLAAAGCSTTTPAQEKQDALTTAGFHKRVADTPAKVASMNAMPSNSFVRQTQKGQTVYLYADPSGCNCIYYGTEDNYGLYQQARYQQRMTDMAARAPIVDDPIIFDYGFDYGPWGGPFFPY
ncbi:MAG: hypothetical protein AB1592_00315 [Pseudomonadota bacterium]